MVTFVVRRIALSIPILLLASVLVFFFVRETTDPLAKYAQNRDVSTKINAGLDIGMYQQPCRYVTSAAGGRAPVSCAKTSRIKQYTFWLSHFVKGDMGQSFTTNEAVSTKLARGFTNTLQLIVWGVLISALVAVAVGVYSAVRQYSVLDYTFTGLAFFGIAMPPFFFGLMAIQIFSYQFSVWFHLHNPLFFSIGLHGNHGPGFLAGLLDYSRHLVLPVATLTVQIIASWSRYQRASMLDVMNSDYIRTARAKGLSRATVVLKHGLRNALIPLVTVMAIDIGALFGGLLVTEQIFSIGGMGKIFIDALTSGDTNVLLPWLMISAVFIVLFNLLADVLYGTLDPRIRLA